MADPLSIASGVAGLAMLAESVAKKIISVMKDVKESKKEMQSLSREVLALLGVLKSVEVIVQSDGNEVASSPCGAIIIECSKTLDRIQQILEGCRIDHQSSNTVTPNNSTNPTNHQATTRPWNTLKNGARWHLKKDTVEKLRADVEKHKSALSLAISQDSWSSLLALLRKQDEHAQQIQDIKAQLRAAEIEKVTRRLKKEQRTALKEFCTIDPDTFLRKHLAARHQGTGTWFLESIQYQQFLSDQNSKLWLYGIPGAGKSVMSSIVIDHVNKTWTPGTATAFFFCDYGNKDTQILYNILGSIAKQLALQNTQALSDMVDFHENKGVPADHDREEEPLLDLIRDMSSHFTSVVVIIDGLDECFHDRSRVVDGVARLSSSGGPLKTLFTSRDESDIRDCLKGFEGVSVAASKADVRLCVASELGSRLKALPSDLKDEILRDLVDRSDGICQLDHLFDLPSNQARREALRDLPPTLPETYQRILERATQKASPQTLMCIERTIRWVALAKTSLNVRQVSHAVSTDAGLKFMDKNTEVDMGKVLRHCSSLIRSFDDKLSFSHFSVKEYLRQMDPDHPSTSRFRIDDHHDQEYLGTTCLRYILLDSHVPLLNMNLDKQEFWGKLQFEHPLYEYAAQHWLSHSRGLISTSHCIFNLVEDLFGINKSDHFILWALVWLSGNHSFRFENIDGASEQVSDITPIHMASLLRLPAIVRSLIRKGADVNRTSKKLSTPLICATKGPERSTKDGSGPDSEIHGTIQSIISGGVSVDTDLHDPLEVAIQKNDFALVSILRKAGFPLRQGLFDIVKSPRDPSISRTIVDALLGDANFDELPEGIQISLSRLEMLSYDQTQQDNTVLNTYPRLFMLIPSHLELQHKDRIRSAANQGQTSRVRDLLAQIPCLTGQSRVYFLSECLVDAAERGHTETVAYLLEESADLAYRREKDQRTALHRAVSRGRFQTVEWILAAAKDLPGILESEDADGMTPWMCAVLEGHLRIFQLFLKSKSLLKLKRTTRTGCSTAHLAVQSQNWQLLKFVQGLGLDVTSKDYYGKTPLHLLIDACADWHERKDEELRLHLLRELARQHRDITEQTFSGDTIPHYLARASPKDARIIFEEISNHADFTPRYHVALRTANKSRLTPLHIAIETLLKRDYLYESELGAWVKIIELLAMGDSGSHDNLSIADSKGRTPILYLTKGLKLRSYTQNISEGFVQALLELFKLLIKSDLDWEQQDHEGSTALHYLFTSGYQRLFTEHLSRIAKCTVRDKEGFIPLAYASESIKDRSMVDSLISLAGENTRIHGNDGRDIFYRACEEGAGAVVGALLQHGRDPNELLGGSNNPKTDNADERKMAKREPPLIIAARSGHIATVKLLLQYGADPLGKGENGWQLLHLALSAGKISSRLRRVLERRDDIDYEISVSNFTKTSNNLWHRFGQVSPIHLAAANEDPGSLRWLLHNQRVRQIDAKTSCGMTALCVASFAGYMQHCKLLVAHGASIAPDQLGGRIISPFYAACCGGHTAICRYLVSMDENLISAEFEEEKRLPIEVAAKWGHTSLVRFLLGKKCELSLVAEANALQNGHEEVANLIRQESMRRGYKHGAPMRDKTRLNQLRLEMVCRKENEQALISLIQEGMDPNARVENGRKTLLHVACSKGWAKAARVLVDQGANIEALDVQREMTPLIMAAWNGQFECAHILCENGADINALSLSGKNVLFGSEVHKNPEHLEALIKAGADLNVRDISGNTPLRGVRTPASIDIMLQHGSDPFIESYRGSPFWSWTTSTDKKMIVSIRKVLTEYPRERILKVIDTRAPGYDATALANTAFMGSTEIVELLIEHGADINLIGSRHGTPIQAARKQGHHSLVGTLLRLGAKPQTMVLPNGQERAAWYWEPGLVHSMPSAEANGAWLPAPLLDGGDQAVDQKNRTGNDEGRISGSANYGWCVSTQTMDGAWIPV